MIRDRYIVMAAAAFFWIGLTVTLRSSWGQRKTTSSQALVNESDRRELEELKAPQGAWLLNFPNSGAERLIKLIEELSGKATGTNYGNVLQVTDGILVENTFASIPVWPNHPNGPFKHSDNEVPETYVPIMAQCTGICTDCHPQYYILNKYEFSKGCYTAHKFSPFDMGTDTTTQYDDKIIKRTVHYIRNPLDNIVERFLQVRNEKDAMGDEIWLQKFPESKMGFQMWCYDVSSRFHNEEKLMWSPEILKAAQGVPCAQEFFRYVQWHGHADQITKPNMMNVVSKFVYESDLIENFQGTTADLLYFLRIDPVTPTSKYNALDMKFLGHSEFYSEEQKQRIACFIKKMSNDVASFLERYTTDCATE